MAATPLEQFEIISIIPITLGSIDISFTNSTFYMLLASSTIVSIFLMSLFNSTIIPNRWQSFIELAYDFVLNLVNENVGPKGLQYFPFIFVTFMFLLVCNLLGMVPYSFTVTSHIIVTFGLSLSMFIGLTIIGFKHHGMHFFSFFMPPGAPIGIAPLLIPIELISYISRAFSLAIRLFANMMSGHTLFKILAGFSWTMLSMGGVVYLAGFLPILILAVLTALELGIAMLQAYVFTILLVIYLSDSIHLH